MKRATLPIVALALLLAAPLAASVKPAQDTRRAAAPPAAPSQPAGERQVPAAEPPAAAPENGSAQSAARGHGAGVTEAPRQGGEGEGHGTGEAEAGESPWATIARLFNFAVLAGSLIYLLRSPFGAFLEGRKEQIRKSLADAAVTREDATRQLAVIDGKLEALPRELEALRQRGAADIAAEEERIRRAADAERERMLAAAKREIERRTQVAERDLVRRAGELAVSVATERVKRTITDADQARLVDRYLEQVRPETIGS